MKHKQLAADLQQALTSLCTVTASLNVLSLIALKIETRFNKLKERESELKRREEEVDVKEKALETKEQEVEEKEEKVQIKSKKLEERQRILEEKENIWRKLEEKVGAKLKEVEERENKVKENEEKAKEFEEKERHWEETEIQMQMNTAKVKQLVDLNVGMYLFTFIIFMYSFLHKGGEYFSVSKALLLKFKDSYFEDMFASNHPQYDNNGRCHISHLLVPSVKMTFL